MKQFSIVRNQLLVGLLVFSIVFSACSSSSSNTQDIAVSKESAPNSGQVYSSNATASNSNASSSTANARAMPGGLVAGEEKQRGERYAEITENPFLDVTRAPLSTFSIDVDTAAYANVRRYLNDGSLPPKDAVRIEEMINYFEYDYPQPAGDLPFSVNTDVATAPWNGKHKIVQIGLQGKKVSLDNLPPSNLVFLIDVSGSMQSQLPMLKDSLRILVNQLSTKDRVAIVVYAGGTGLALPSTNNKGEILSSLDRLAAGGSTNGGAGIQLAYRVALDNFIQGGNNRVILATDGDFNVGPASDDALVSLIEEKRRSGVFLSVLGFSAGNLNDSMMEKVADKGNGNYAYIDSREEARKALGQQVAGTLYTIAKDVKIQVEFNPAKVAGYRLIGYENRLLADRDFNDDKKDAGEIGAGHSVTALYEIVPAGTAIDNQGVDDLKYSKVERSGQNFGNEMMTVKLRYKEPDENESKLLSVGVLDANKSIDAASENLRFASAVAQFGLIMRDSRYKGSASFTNVNLLAQNALGSDMKSYRGEFLELVRKAQRLKG